MTKKPDQPPEKSCPNVVDRQAILETLWKRSAIRRKLGMQGLDISTFYYNRIHGIPHPTPRPKPVSNVIPFRVAQDGGDQSDATINTSS